MKKKLNKTAIAIVTATLSFFAYFAAATYFHSKDPLLIATIIIVSLMVHEIGHMIVLNKYGIGGSIVFLVAFGGTIPNSSCVDKLKYLEKNKHCYISMAGAIGNLLLVGVCIALWQTKTITFRQLEQVVNLNGILIFYNLIPFISSDGYRLIALLFGSMLRHQNRVYAFGIAIVIFTAGFAASIVTHRSLLFDCWLLYACLRYQADHNEAPFNQDEQATTLAPAQVKRWAYIYIALMIVAAVMITSTRYWFV